MHSRHVVALTAAALLAATGAPAKFGISKTRLMLPRPVPAAQPLLAESVFLEVRAEGRDVGGSQVDEVRDRLAQALTASGLYQLSEAEAEGAARVSVWLRDLNAEVRDEIRMESKYVKVGERQEWDDKKKKYVKKDVYGYRDEPVTWVRADGSAEAELEIDAGDGQVQRRRVSADYRQEDKRDGSLPDPMRSEHALRDWLTDELGARTVAEVVVHPEPVEALLAVNGELKAGNQLAQAGRFKEALTEWKRRTFKGNTEAARLHNVGVAYEAIAYGLPPWDQEHHDLLENARDHYQRARQLDPDEKYFNPPLERIAASLANADAIVAQKAAIDRFRSEQPVRRAVPAGPVSASRTPESAGGGPGSAASGTTPPPSGGSPTLRNGSFDMGLGSWMLSGKGAVVAEPGRPNVAQLLAGSGTASLSQTLAFAVPESATAPFRLDYRVVSGDVRISLRLVYVDAQGKERTSSLEVTAGEGPAGWLSWGSDLATVRPRPAELRELRVEASGGTLQIDAVSLAVR